MQLLIAGDLVPTKSNIKLFNAADLHSLLGDELLLLWNQADMRIFNLEAPIADDKNPIDKNGAVFNAPVSTISGIKALNPSLITLANNHVFDQGEQGLKTTKDILKSNNIPYVGVGNNLSEASKPYIIENCGIKIGIYACAEHEFSIATEKTPGANPFDPLESFDHVESLINKCDYVIVLYHGGKEHYQYPSPYLQKVCRKLAQKGADLIICQHSHCIGCFEEYDKSTIVYGQGNFLFDNLHSSEYWDTSLILKITAGNEIKIEYIPVVKNGNGVRLADGAAKEKIMELFLNRSQELLHEGLIEQNYKEFAKSKINIYLKRFSGHGKLFLMLDSKLFKGRLMKKSYNKMKLLAMQNYIECEAHRELFIEGLKIEEKQQ